MMADNDLNWVACEENFTGDLYVIKMIFYKDRYLNICNSE